MSSLRDKLAALGHRVASTEKREEDAHASEDLGVLLGAREQSSPSGSVLVRTARFPIEAPWGASTLASPRFGAVIRGYAGGDLAGLHDPSRTVFVDTETTGLAGGSGTYPFLVGIGRFTSDAFVLRQLFLRGPWEERALLETASLLLEGATAVVTYNGKSFDVPLLQGRLAYHGLPDPLRRTPHVDLLHISRRLWRERLVSCTLGDVEQGALGMRRGGDDVPGHLIPELYFSFLRSGDATPLRGVMHHNELDICSLAALLIHVDDVLEGRQDATGLPIEDVVSLARTREWLGHHEDSLRLLEVALARYGELLGAGAELALDASLRAGRLAKRMGRYAEAAGHWRRAAEVDLADAATAMIELAKLAEHQHRDPERALHWADRALAASEGAADRWQRERLATELAHRRERLLRKLGALEEDSGAPDGPAFS